MGVWHVKWASLGWASAPGAFGSDQDEGPAGTENGHLGNSLLGSAAH